MQQPEDELDSVGEARAAFYATADLRAYWYPLAPLPIPKPIALHILGDPIVAYGDTVLADKCAHRSVPLSTGSIRDGNLEWYLLII